MQLKHLSLFMLVQIDTSDEASIVKVANELQGVPIDLLLNNAGIGEKDSLESATKASLMRQFEVNAVGPFLVTRALLPNLKLAAAASGSAVVGQVSSRMGSIDDNTSGGLYGYRASKAGVNMINASLAADLKDDQIIAVALHPGYVVTRITGFSGALQPDESVAGLANVIAGLAPADSGKFISYDGKIVPW